MHNQFVIRRLPLRVGPGDHPFSLIGAIDLIAQNQRAANGTYGARGGVSHGGSVGAASR